MRSFERIEEKLDASLEVMWAQIFQSSHPSESSTGNSSQQDSIAYRDPSPRLLENNIMETEVEQDSVQEVLQVTITKGNVKNCTR